MAARARSVLDNFCADCTVVRLRAVQLLKETPKDCLKGEKMETLHEIGPTS